MASPRYLDTLLRRLPPSLDQGELHLHLGHGEGELRAAQGELLRRVLALAELADGQTVLDVGCGIGGTVAAIVRSHEDMRVVGLDVGRRQLERAARHVTPRGSDEVRWVQGDAVDLPFPAATFDRVLCVEAMFHFSSRARFFHEAARVLAPGGRLAVTDIRLAPDADEELVAFVTDGLGPWPDPHGTEGGLLALAAAAGLDFAIEDATAAIGPSLTTIIGAEAIAAPAAIDDAGDRGTAALGALFARGALELIYGSGSKG